MAEQRDEAITPKTAEAEPVTVAVHTNQAVTETEVGGAGEGAGIVSHSSC